MVPVIVAGLMLLLVAHNRADAAPAPTVEAAPPSKEKAAKIPVPPRMVHPSMSRREPRRPIDVHEYQRDFATPPMFKVELTGYQIPGRSPQY